MELKERFDRWFGSVDHCNMTPRELAWEAVTNYVDNFKTKQEYEIGSVIEIHFRGDMTCNYILAKLNDDIALISFSGVLWKKVEVLRRSPRPFPVSKAQIDVLVGCGLQWEYKGRSKGFVLDGDPDCK